MERRKKYTDLSLALSALLIMLLTLFSDSQIGLSDNGDFARVMTPNYIAYENGTGTPFAFTGTYNMDLPDVPLLRQVRLLFTSRDTGYYPSPQHFFVRAAILINLVLNKVTGDGQVYRIGVYGVLMCVLYAALLYALFRHIRLKNPWDTLFKLIIILILCDVGYTAYFNSFYSESIQVLALLCVAVTCVILEKPEPRLFDTALFMASLVFYGCSKLVNIPVGMAGILLFLYPIVRKTASGHKKYAAMLCGGAFLSLVLIYMSIPKWMDSQTNYNAVFYGVLSDTDAVQTAEYLNALKLPSYMAELRGTHFYMEEILPVVTAGRFASDFSHIDKMTLLKFYLGNPRHLLSKLDISIKNSGFIRPFYLSNSGTETERASLTNRFSLWSNLRKYLPFDRTWANILLASAFILVFPLLPGGRRDTLPLFLFFLLSALYALLIPVICNGEADLAKHMFAYAQLVDYAVLLLLYLTFREFSMLRRPGICSYISLAILAAFALSASGEIILNAAQARKPRTNLEPGSYISFGHDARGPITWIVTESGADGIVLLAANCVRRMSFSSDGKYGSNLWKDSDIRKWLNNEFFSRFSPEERALILPSENRYVLSAPYKRLAVTGSRPFPCRHVPELCAAGLEDAYSTVLSDYVFLPDTAALQKLLKVSGTTARETPYWLSTPYYSNGSMVRVVDRDGYVYMRDASGSKGVVPMLRLKSFEPAGGRGSISEPFYSAPAPLELSHAVARR